MCGQGIDGGDPYLQGHFPEVTIYPGVFLIESLHQAVCTALAVPDCPPPQIVEVRRSGSSRR